MFYIATAFPIGAFAPDGELRITRMSLQQAQAAVPDDPDPDQPRTWYASVDEHFANPLSDWLGIDILPGRRQLRLRHGDSLLVCTPSSRQPAHTTRPDFAFRFYLVHQITPLNTEEGTHD